MKISEVELKRVKTDRTLVAFASCVLKGEFNIKLSSIAIHYNGIRYWITFPKIKTPQGELFYSYHPMDNMTLKAIEDAVIEKYEKEIMIWGEEGIKHLHS